MTTPMWQMYPSPIQTWQIDWLDYWTQVSIEAHFAKLVEEAKEVNTTGKTSEDETSHSGG